MKALGIYIEEEFALTQQQIKAFWSWFEEREAHFFNLLQSKEGLQEQFLEELSPAMKAINEEFWFLAGMYDDQTAELIVTAEGDVKIIPLIEELMRLAPDLSNWKFTALNPGAESFNMTMGPYYFSADNLFFFPIEHDDSPDEIDLRLVHTDGDMENYKEMQNGALVYVDNLIGELNAAQIIDFMSFLPMEEAKGENLIPIHKLKSYLLWREKEFLEKYEDMDYYTEEDVYLSYQGTLSNGNTEFASINQDLLQWEGKASHPWIAVIDLFYEGKDNAFPIEEDNALLKELEEELDIELTREEGYLYVGKTVGNFMCRFFYAARDFRGFSKLMAGIECKYGAVFEMDYQLFKDKYWNCLRSFE